MSSKPQLSRRDWFRLRVPQPDHESFGAERRGGMEPVADPVNHGGLDLADLPPMHEAVLSPEQVSALFADLENHAEDVQLMVRGTSPDATQLSERLRRARDLLLRGEIAKMQVRYRWQAARWIDTLEKQPAGIRLVRIQHR